MPLKIKVGGGGMRGSSKQSSQAKKVAPPVIPGGEMSRNNNSRPPANQPPPTAKADCCDSGMYITLPNGSCTSSPVHPYSNSSSYALYSGHQHVAQVYRGSQVSSCLSGANLGPLSYSQPNSPREPNDEGGFSPYQIHPPTYQQQTSIEDQGIDVQSPGRDSPGSSGSSSGSGCRHSITSLDSGRASSSAYDGRCSHVFLAGTNQHRLSAHSYESSTSLRQSYHSSSSSLGSMDRLDEHTPTTPSYSTPAQQINVSKLLRDGVPEAEVLRRWLCEQRFEEYFHLFVQSGYDMPTISRMTPEDLTAIGITNPSHRKKLKVEIGKLNISDGLPDYIPNSLDEWLRLLRLDEYSVCLQQQGYNKVNDVIGIAWEDLEEIGIQRLGHQKKMMLAIKRLKDIQSGIKRFSSSTNNNESSLAHHRTPIEVKCQVLSPPSSAGAVIAVTPPFQPYVEAGSALNGYASNVNSPSHLIYKPDIVAIQVRHPSGAKSLENLEENGGNVSGNVAHRHQTFLQPVEMQQQQQQQQQHRWTVQGPGMSSCDVGAMWRRGSFDDGDITPTNESYVEVEGGGTLPRPKVSIKPRPVAKIMAKTRATITSGSTECDIITSSTRDDVMECKSAVNDVVTVAEVHNSPRRSLPASPLMASSASFRKKVPPPTPPKRTNSMCEKQRTSSAEFTADEQLFASCVKSIASKFGLRSGSSEWGSASLSVPSSNAIVEGGINKLNEVPLSSPSDEGSDLSMEINEEIPDRTPPSPAPGSPVHHRQQQQQQRLQSKEGVGTASFLSKRNNESITSFESVASSSSSNSSSSSSGDGTGNGSNTLPFANENVGTIKIKSNQGLSRATSVPQAVPARSAPATPKRRSSLKGGLGCDFTPPTADPADQEAEQLRICTAEGASGDVLTDIDNMLANLSSELDAMLTNQLETD